jgi:hypothetical protein
MTVKVNPRNENEIYILDVKCNWAVLATPQGYPKGNMENRKYSIELVLDKKDVVALKKLKINKTFKEIGLDVDAEGLYEGQEGMFKTKFTAKEFNSSGKATQIVVAGTDGEKFDDLIGNGSNVSIALYTWDSRAAAGKLDTKLTKVRVNELVEYKSETGGGSGDAPTHDDILGINFSKAAAKKAPATQDVADAAFEDDDLLF